MPNATATAVRAVGTTLQRPPRNASRSLSLITAAARSLPVIRPSRTTIRAIGVGRDARLVRDQDDRHALGPSRPR